MWLSWHIWHIYQLCVSVWERLSVVHGTYHLVISIFRSFLLQHFGTTVIEDEPNELTQICHFYVLVGFLRKSRSNRQLDRDMSWNWVVLWTLVTTSLSLQKRNQENTARDSNTKWHIASRNAHETVNISEKETRTSVSPQCVSCDRDYCALLGCEEADYLNPCNAPFTPRKTNAKTKIFFDVCCLFFWVFFACSLIIFAFAPGFSWCEEVLRIHSHWVRATSITN